MSSFEKMMEELRRDYIGSLPQKIIDIESHLAQKDVPTLRDDFHKLKGTGRTYGVPEISDLGEVVEKLCMKKPEQIGAVIPIAVALLRQIHQHRSQGQPFEVLTDKSFARLLSFQ